MIKGNTFIQSKQYMTGELIQSSSFKMFRHQNKFMFQKRMKFYIYIYYIYVCECVCEIVIYIFSIQKTCLCVCKYIEYIQHCTMGSGLTLIYFNLQSLDVQRQNMNHLILQLLCLNAGLSEGNKLTQFTQLFMRLAAKGSTGQLGTSVVKATAV